MGVETERLEKGLDAEEESYAGHSPIDVDSIEKQATHSYKTNSSPGRRRWVQEWKVSEAYMKYRKNVITISFSLLGAACPVRKLGSVSVHSKVRKPRLRRRLLRILFFHRASLRGGMNSGN